MLVKSALITVFAGSRAYHDIALNVRDALTLSLY